MKTNKQISIAGRKVGSEEPTYFIADVAANHDGDLERAKNLIALAKECGADAVKFQHHDVKKYVSDYGFKKLGGKFSHQSKWNKSIFEVYKDAEVSVSWTETLKETADKVGIDFFSTPYDLDMVDHLDPYISAYKIGSGDLNWDDMLIKIAKKNKPVIISSGACTIGEVAHAVMLLSSYDAQIILMQCNTNYTADTSNFDFINLNVLKSYETMFSGVVIGLSDHTLGHVTVLGSVALGGRVIEKHFTDDNNREGPDHPFSMNPKSWREMVEQTRLLERAMGSSLKCVQANEKETVVLQRRSIRAIQDIEPGDIITRDKIEFQRPAPNGSFIPNEFKKLENKKVKIKLIAGDYLRLEHIDWIE